MRSRLTGLGRLMSETGLSQATGKPLFVFGRQEIARIAHGSSPFGVAVAGQGDEATRTRCVGIPSSSVHPSVQAQALDFCSPLGHSSVREGGDASASRSLNEECWMSGRPLPMSRKAAGVHGCLVVFVWLTGDLCSHCAPYIDVDEALRSRARSHWRKLYACSG